MLVIRLARTGRNKYPTYRIVAAESARAATGKFVAVLGHYNPHTKELKLQTDEIKKHLANGAQPSNTVTKLLTREKMDLPGWVKLKTKAPKVAETPAEEAAATDVTPEEAAAESPETPEAVVAAEGERVGEVATDVAASGSDDAANINSTETAASEAQVQVDAEAATDAADDAAGVKPE